MARTTKLNDQQAVYYRQQADSSKSMQLMAVPTPTHRYIRRGRDLPTTSTRKLSILMVIKPIVSEYCSPHLLRVSVLQVENRRLSSTAQPTDRRTLSLHDTVELVQKAGKRALIV